MSPALKSILVFAAALALAGCGLRQSGLLAPRTHSASSCRAITGFSGGTEDFAVDYAMRQIFVSAHDPANAHDGAIYVLGFDVLEGEASPRRVSPDLRNFNPHGIGLWVGAGGQRRLFVVNHPRGEPSRVDIFDVAPDGALRLSSDGGAWRELPRPNDVAPQGPTSFYAFNDHGGPGRTTEGGGVFDLVEAIFSLNLASVVQVDARGRAHRSADGLTFANGIALSRDMSRLYVAETIDGTVRAYQRSPAGDLTLEQRIGVGPGPDNLVLDEQGRIWVGANDSLPALAWRRLNPDSRSPGRAFWLSRAGAVSKPIFQTDGRDLSALSVAAAIDGRVVIGSIDQPQLLVCSSDDGQKNGAEMRTDSAAPQDPSARHVISPSRVERR